jgi:hypothetical protein
MFACCELDAYDELELEFVFEFIVGREEETTFASFWGGREVQHEWSHVTVTI